MTSALDQEFILTAEQHQLLADLLLDAQQSAELTDEERITVGEIARKLTNQVDSLEEGEVKKSQPDFPENQGILTKSQPKTRLSQFRSPFLLNL